jgi:AcrR family transcriptional regulator
MEQEAEGASVSTGRSQRPANRELRAQGLRTRTLIVRAATKLLLQGGGLDFTLRAAARQAKISVSNLQYYFPDRQALLRAVMAPIIDDYLAELNRALSGSVPPRQALYGLFERELRDLKNPKTRELWTHFAALACVDPECARLFDEWYGALVQGIGQLVIGANPAIKPAAGIQLAALLIAMGDGLGFLIGRSHGYVRELDGSFLAAIDFMLDQGPQVLRKTRGGKP